jgi:hypothetical protein
VDARGRFDADESTAIKLRVFDYVAASDVKRLVGKDHVPSKAAAAAIKVDANAIQQLSVTIGMVQARLAKI